MIGKAQANGKIPVWVYDPARKAKNYLGLADSQDEAVILESNGKIAVRTGINTPWTVEHFAIKFLTAHHGENTTRPEPTTKKVNEQNLRAFRRDHGTKLLREVSREDAQKIAKARPHEAKTIAAMYAVAVDTGYVSLNPFARLGLPRSRGRADIDPLTEAEVERIAAIALKASGTWGPELWALLLWMAWTGMRPGEVCALDVGAHIDWQAREVRVEDNMRNDGTVGPVKGRERREIVVADEAIAAARSLRRTSGHLFLSPSGKPLRPNSLRHYWQPVRAAFTATLDESHWLPRRLIKDPDDQLVPYELRHFCGSMLADRGLNARDIAAHLGNTERVCEVYLHDHKDRQKARIRAAFNQHAADDVAMRTFPDGQQLGRISS